MTNNSHRRNTLPIFNRLEPRLMLSGTTVLETFPESPYQIDVPTGGSVSIAGQVDAAGDNDLTLTCQPIDDDDNTFETAKTMLLNQSGEGHLDGTIRYHDDSDTLSVVATQTGTMQVSMVASVKRSELDGELFAYDVDGNLLSYNDNYGDGTDSFVSFDVVEGQVYYLRMVGADENTGPYRINITTSQPLVPVNAANDAAVTDESTGVIIDVLANDTAAEGISLNIIGFTQSASGTVSLNGDGTLTYNPDADYHGEDVFTYTVTDGNGGESTATVHITVTEAPNTTPTAVIITDATSGFAPTTIAFDGAGSNNTDGGTLSFLWDFGDGSTATSINTSHTYQTPGDYIVTLTVSDGNGGSDVSTVAISITEAPSDQPGWVDWSAWTKRSEAVFSGQYGVASDPSVIYDNGLYRMYHTGLDVVNLRTIICEAVSTDGISWEYLPTGGQHQGMILNGTSGQMDENLEGVTVLKEADRTLMFYSGYRDEGDPIKGFPAALFAATSTDGETFERVSDSPILEPTSGWYDNDALYSPTVIKHNGQYIMIYTGHSYTNSENIAAPGVYLLSATSSDGINWTKNEEPLMGPGSEIDWMADGAAEASIIEGPDGKFYLFFTGLNQEERVIGVAYSDSPLGQWTVREEPIVIPTADSFDQHQVLAPTVTYENGTLRMWYLGVDNDQNMVTGYTEASWDLP